MEAGGDAIKRLVSEAVKIRRRCINRKTGANMVATSRTVVMSAAEGATAL